MEYISMPTIDQIARDRSVATQEKSGKSFPLGATVLAEGTNFSIFSKHATEVQILMFEHVDDPEPAQIMKLDRDRNRTYHYWHMFVPGISTGQIYAYRV